MNSKFLEGFDDFYILEFTNVSNVQPALATLPSLPTLNQLRIINSVNADFDTDMEYDTSSILSPNLLELDLADNNWDEVPIGWILGLISKRNSTNNPRLNIFLDRNAMSRTPPEMGLISGILKLSLTHNALPMRITHTGQSYYMDFRESNIVDVSPGAFLGINCDYSYIQDLYLMDNHLTRFEEDVFYPVLVEFSQYPLFVFYNVIYIHGSI